MLPKKAAVFSLHSCPLASEEKKETGGMNVYVLETSKALAKQGIQIDVFTRSQDTIHQVVKVCPNFRVIHLKAGPQKPINKKAVINYLKEFADNFNKFVRTEKIYYDLFHAHYYLSGLAALKVLGQTPLVVNFHTLALMKNLVARTEAEREDEARIKAEKLLVKKAQKVIEVSESQALYLQYLYNCPQEKITIITPGVDKNVFKPIDQDFAKSKIGAFKKHKIILFVGRIEPLKGIDILMYALKIVCGKSPHLAPCLWIVGGKASHYLEKLRKDLGLFNVVKFVGQKPQNKLPFYYNASEVIVFPSHYESFGLAALEAMACGVPVIITNVSGISDLLDEKYKSLVTSCNNPLLLSSQIEKMLINQKQHEKVNKEILANIADLTWENCAAKINKLYVSQLA